MAEQVSHLEHIEWRLLAKAQLPDSDMTVLVNMPTGDEPVWLGYWDDAARCWMSVEGFALLGVVAWADMPAGLASKARKEAAP